MRKTLILLAFAVAILPLATSAKTEKRKEPYVTVSYERKMYQFYAKEDGITVFVEIRNDHSGVLEDTVSFIALACGIKINAKVQENYQYDRIARALADPGSDVRISTDDEYGSWTQNIFALHPKVKRTMLSIRYDALSRKIEPHSVTRYEHIINTPPLILIGGFGLICLGVGKSRKDRRSNSIKKTLRQVPE